MGSSFPEPFIVPPSGEHTHTLFMLHGRGDQGMTFALILYSSCYSPDKTLPQLFPGWKFVFPTTKKRWSTRFQGNMNEWFDLKSLVFPNEHQELQYEGLRESITHVRDLVLEEAKVLPPERILIGGISQGAAVAVHAALCLNMQLGGILTFCTWLPLSEVMQRVSEAKAEDMRQQLAEVYRGRLSIEWAEINQSDFSKTPLLMSHCADDGTVDIGLGRLEHRILSNMGYLIEWIEFQDGGHWIKAPQGYKALANFLKQKETLDKASGSS